MREACRGARLFFASDAGGVLALAPGRLESQPDWFEELDEKTQQEALLAEERGEFSGARLFLRKPAVYKACAAALMSGELGGVKRIAKALGVSVNTVRAVRDREGISVDTLREKIAKTALCTALDMLERMRDESHEMPVGQLAVPFGIVAEKAELYGGRATQRVETVTIAPIEDFNDYIAKLPSAHPAGMGLGAGTPGQKEAAGEVSKLGAPGVSDSQSLVLPCSEPVVGAIDTASDTALPVAADDPQGGRGSLSEPPLSPSQLIPPPPT